MSPETGTPGVLDPAPAGMEEGAGAAEETAGNGLRRRPLPARLICGVQVSPDDLRDAVVHLAAACLRRKTCGKERYCGLRRPGALARARAGMSRGGSRLVWTDAVRSGQMFGKPRAEVTSHDSRSTLLASRSAPVLMALPLSDLREKLSALDRILSSWSEMSLSS